MILSRIAEHLYWMVRYMERAENTARLINTTTNFVLDIPRNTAINWGALLVPLKGDALFRQYYAEMDEASVMRFLISDSRNPDSLLSCLSKARDNVRTFREILPREAYEQTNSLYLMVKDGEAEAACRSRRYDFMGAVIQKRQALIGLLVSSMSHDESYQFIRLGRNVERAYMTACIIDVSTTALLPVAQANDPYLNLRWMNVLESLSAYSMYRRHIQARVSGPKVLDFLIRDKRFPRTLSSCIAEISDCVACLVNNNLPLSAIASIESELQRTNAEQLVKSGLGNFIEDFQKKLVGIDGVIADTYFRQARSHLAAA